MAFAVRALGFLGATYGASAVALSAYASHGLAARVPPAALQRAWTAIAFLFVHALLLVAIATLARVSAALLLTLSGFAAALGTLLFCGSVLVSVLFGWSSAAAPAGGMLLIVAWLLLAVWFVGARTR